MCEEEGEEESWTLCFKEEINLSLFDFSFPFLEIRNYCLSFLCSYSSV